MMRSFDFYKNFSAARFADDDYFRDWVLRPDESQERFWAAYLATHLEHAGTLAEARKLVEKQVYRSDIGGPLSDNERTALKNEIFEAIGIPQEQPKIRRIGLPLKFAAAAAAAVILVFAGLHLLQNASKKESPALLAERTGANEIKTILLPDSSVVILNAGSSLQFSPGLGSMDNREVWLNGNAFFNVRKDAAIRKFVIHTHSLDVTVL